MPKYIFDAALLARAEKALARSSAIDLISKLPMARAAGRPDKSWYNFSNAAENEADILIYDEIGYWGVTAADFVHDLAEVEADVINLRINSPGGSVFDGIAIYNSLVQHKAKIIVHIEGWAASIASVIAMAGDEIRIGEAAQIMIHKPWSFVMGTDDDLRKEADVLESLEEAIVDVYEARTGADRAEIAAWVKAETWFKGKAAVDVGFADEVVPLKLKQNVAAPAARLGVEFFASIFQHLPDEVRASIKVTSPAAAITTKREFEDVLAQCLGFSSTKAKAIADNGFKVKEPPGGAKPEAPPAAEPPGEAVKRATAAAAIRLAAITFPQNR